MVDGPCELQTSSGVLPGTLYHAESPRALLVFAHGAGAGRAHPWMRGRASDLRERGLSVVTFDFPYMAQGRRVPDKAPVLVSAFRDVVAHAATLTSAPLLIGGKSMGGRMATMLAAEHPLHPAVIGVVSMGYPLHPPGKPDQLRVAHLGAVEVPWLAVQGTRDPFGSADDIAEACRVAGVSPTLVSVPDGGHGFEVPKRSGSQATTFAAVADAVSNWLDTLLSASEQ